MIEPTLTADVETLASTFSPERADLLRYILQLGEDGMREQCSTLRVNGEIVAIAGVVPMTDPGYLVAFAFVTEKARDRRLALTRWAKECMEVVEARFSPRRLEITVAKREPSHLEWAEVLGFAWEGSMRHYGQDRSTHERMARVW